MMHKDTPQGGAQGAPGARKQPEIAGFPPPQKRRRGAPLGSANALKHGAYSLRMTPEEETYQASFEADLLRDLGGDASTAQRALIHRASFSKDHLIQKILL